MKRNSRVVEVGGERPELRLRLEVLDDSEVREVALERHDEDESARSAARSRVRTRQNAQTASNGGVPPTYYPPAGSPPAAYPLPTYPKPPVEYIRAARRGAQLGSVIGIAFPRD